MTDTSEFEDRETHVGTAPLSEIRLKNFKSVREAKVELRSLTAIVGRNSSGKSTLIQSVLALSQAVQNDSKSVQFPLNGKFVKLGTFDELRNFSAGDGEGIEIGFSVTHRRQANGSRFPQGSGTPDVDVAWDAYLAKPALMESGFADLAGFQFRVETGGNDEPRLRVDLDVGSLSETESSEISSDQGWPSDSRFRSILRADGRITNFASGESSRVEGVRISGAIPRGAFRLDSFFEIFASQWWSVCEVELESELREEKIAYADLVDKPSSPSTRAVKEAAADIRSVHEFSGRRESNELRFTRRDAGEGVSLSESYFELKIQTSSPRVRKNIAKSMVQLGEIDFRTRLRKSLRSEEWLDEVTLADAGGDPRGSLLPASRVVSSLLRDVRYLGPLREEPKVNYSPGPGAVDLGRMGEFSAAVLHAQTQAKTKVLTPLPDGGTRLLRVDQALNLWLSELGLADRASTSDRGRLGIGLTVTPVGSSREVDLTSVGVGVSQAFPVLLLCLLARRGMVVLLEQPELHLHPAMQLKMADFLLACARSGRQIIVETHSEHLINRLRRHVAEDESGINESTIRLLFAEQEDGETKYRHSDINGLGGLEADWPKGFLDVGSDEAGQLLRLNLQRRASRESLRD